MESLVDFERLFGGMYKNKKVLITGHTGFKGSWLALWLHKMGARVYGYSLAPDSSPNHCALLDVPIIEAEADICDAERLRSFFADAQPDIVFHLAAQALVRESYADPLGTYATNVMGTLNVLEVARNTASVKAIVVVSSDKCYENKEWEWGYRENDPMGGYDPYSSSKGCTELLTASFRNSFFNLAEYSKTHTVLLGSGRAGNVIGGGDWATDRLIPDIVRAASVGTSVEIRNPFATRPWQHVLEPLSGYLLLGFRLLEGKKAFADGWNFGPSPESNLNVNTVGDIAARYWDKISLTYPDIIDQPHEANLLMLDCSKARMKMEWKPVWGIEDTVRKTIGWYKSFYTDGILSTAEDIEEYVLMAINKELVWTE